MKPTAIRRTYLWVAGLLVVVLGIGLAGWLFLATPHLPSCRPDPLGAKYLAAAKDAVAKGDFVRANRGALAGIGAIDDRYRVRKPKDTDDVDDTGLQLGAASFSERNNDLPTAANLRIQALTARLALLVSDRPACAAPPQQQQQPQPQPAASSPAPAASPAPP